MKNMNLLSIVVLIALLASMSHGLGYISTSKDWRCFKVTAKPCAYVHVDYNVAGSSADNVQLKVIYMCKVTTRVIARVGGLNPEL